MKVKFVKSAQNMSQCPPEDRPEVALAGRSNAGKSSFLNALCRRRIAKVSGSPGKTRLLNFFDFGDHYRIVDMPGYGYASRSKTERKDWGGMVESYLKDRPNLVGLVLIMDIRREWQGEEEALQDWCEAYDIPFAIVLTKADKVSRNIQNQKRFKTKKQTRASEVFVVSNLEKMGQLAAEEYFFREWVEPELQGEAL